MEKHVSACLLHKPHRPAEDAPDEFDPGSLPVEPDEGPIPAAIPEDPEHERLIDPSRRAPWAAKAGRVRRADGTSRGIRHG